MSDSTAFEDWLEALPYDERATLCFKKVWDAAQACKDDPQQRTYCLKHYRQTFPGKGCDMCEMEARIEALEKKWSIVFDGYSVLQGLTKEQKLFVSPEAVAAVLDSVAKLAALLQEPTK